MYAAGAEHPNKAPAIAFLVRVAEGEIEATVDAEVLHDIIHRYRSPGRWSDGTRVYSPARKIFPPAIPVTCEIADRAQLVMDGDHTLSARNAVHAAVAMTHRMAGIGTFDLDFDRISGCVRIAP